MVQAQAKDTWDMTGTQDTVYPRGMALAWGTVFPQDTVWAWDTLFPRDTVWALDKLGIPDKSGRRDMGSSWSYT
ncbi:hypothetical protein ATCVNTS1_179R [Acanthocystis turfacea Chlorella virus NTS-1]|nr:hypothetical protein ATCVNTS1_179R [Acanthocystis turfacea Chlorella virus NTS-1]